MEKMKTLTIQGTTFEIFDEQARADIVKLQSSGENAVLYTAQTLTEEQKAQAMENIGISIENIVQDVIEALGTPVFGRVDVDNNIILSGALVDGVYTLKYEDSEGNVITIGTLENKSTEDFTNWLPLAINSDGSLYNGGQGWKADYRLNSTGNEVEFTGTEVTGFIPAKYGDVLRLYNITVYDGTNAYISFYDSSFAFLGYQKPTGTQINDHVTEGIPLNDTDLTSIGLHTKSFNGDATQTAYIRLCCAEISNESIITINEEVPA